MVAPGSRKIAPPEPEVPFAVLSLNSQSLIKRSALVTYIAPPSTSTPLIKLRSSRVTLPEVILKILPLPLASIVLLITKPPLIVISLSISISLLSVTVETPTANVMMSPGDASKIS